MDVVRVQFSAISLRRSWLVSLEAMRYRLKHLRLGDE